MLPHPQENLLRHVLGLRVIAEHPARQTDHSGKVTAYEFSSGALVAAADTTHQFFVRIPHGLGANSESR